MDKSSKYKDQNEHFKSTKTKMNVLKIQEPK